jgi:hypothetical protein
VGRGEGEREREKTRQHERDSMREHYRLLSLINIDIKILNKILGAESNSTSERL